MIKPKKVPLRAESNKTKTEAIPVLSDFMMRLQLLILERPRLTASNYPNAHRAYWAESKRATRYKARGLQTLHRVVAATYGNESEAIREMMRESLNSVWNGRLVYDHETRTFDWTVGQSSDGVELRNLILWILQDFESKITDRKEAA